MSCSLDLWNSRARLGATAGSQDVIAAELERRAILAHITEARRVQRVLDVGCGTGETATLVALERCGVDVIGWDYAPEMIAEANKHIPFERGRFGTSSLQFSCLDIRGSLPSDLPFDTIYTQRCIINLGDWEAQQQAIRYILSRLKPGGQYLMCECSQEGLDEINQLRAAVGLRAIVPPWHNRYLRDEELHELEYDLVDEGVIEPVDIEYPLSTYALLSRVVNAALSEQPAYDAPVNQLALKLPALGQLGQNRLWIWRRQ